MRRLMIAALSALILLCTPFSGPQGCGLHSIRWTPLMINPLIQAGSPAATNLRPVAPPSQAPASARGAAPSARIVFRWNPASRSNESFPVVNRIYIRSP